MNESESDSKKQTAELGARHFLSVLLVPVLVCLATTVVAGLFGGLELAVVASISAIACLAGVVGGHILSVVPRGELFFSLRLMLSSSIRVAVPLITLLVCQINYPELLQRGMAYFVFLFYLVGLASELVTRIQRLGAARTAVPAVDQSAQALGKSSQFNGTNGAR